MQWHGDTPFQSNIPGEKQVGTLLLPAPAGLCQGQKQQQTGLSSQSSPHGVPPSVQEQAGAREGSLPAAASHAWLHMPLSKGERREKGIF